MVHSEDTFMMHNKVLSLFQARLRLIGEALKGITPCLNQIPLRGNKNISLRQHRTDKKINNCSSAL